MELEKIRNRWSETTLPTYSSEELGSIYSIKQANVLSLLKNGLRVDLLIAEAIVVVFILTLQYLNLSTSNFWSVVMAFLGIQHLVIYVFQAYLINKSCQFDHDVKSSIGRTIGKLKNLRRHYRIWPPVLTSVLYTLYFTWFDIPLNNSQIIITALVILITVVLLSEYLSSRMVQSRIDQLSELQKDLT